MMINPIAVTVRAKKLGVLIRDAREASGKSIADCAQAIGVDEARFRSYEYGENSPSMPEVEILAYYLGIPLEHFWGNNSISEGGSSFDELNQTQLVGLRQRIIGTLLRQARMDESLSVDELAEEAGVDPEILEVYELGKLPIPLPVLEALSGALNRPVKEFQDLRGPVGRWMQEQRMVRDFLLLSPDLQSFVSKPVNRPYLELAQRLSEMSVDKLRAVAEGLLEITL